MAVNVTNVHIDTAALDKITANIKPNAARIVNSYGLAITSRAIKLAPVDTGALINSISARSDMIGDLTFRVQDGVIYGVFQELGTSKMAAQPFLVPAVEAFREKFLAAFGSLFK